MSAQPVSWDRWSADYNEWVRNRPTAEERAERAYELRRAGWTYERIGYEFGVTGERARQLRRSHQQRLLTVIRVPPPDCVDLLRLASPHGRAVLDVLTLR